MDFLKLLKTLRSSGAEFVVVGGVAARLYGSTRLTHDVDIVPMLTPESWPSLVGAIWEAGGRPRIPEPRDAVENLENVLRWIDEKGMLALTFRAPDGSAEIDLLVAESPRFAHLKANATRVELDGQEFLVAGLNDLIAMKQKAGRPQDLLDIEHLKELQSRIE